MHKAAAPASPAETPKDPTRSSHYILWGPRFLDVSLMPEQQELKVPTDPPSSTIRQTSGQWTIIKSPGRDSARP